MFTRTRTLTPLGSFSAEGETIKIEIMKTAAVRPSSHQISRINSVKGQAIATPAARVGFHNHTLRCTHAAFHFCTVGFSDHCVCFCFESCRVSLWCLKI